MSAIHGGAAQKNDDVRHRIWQAAKSRENTVERTRNMVWVLLALGGAICTSLTTILAKIGIKDVNSNFATAYRTGIVIVCSLVMCAITGDIAKFANLTAYNWLFLVLSGLATGVSWLFYFGALKEGDVNKVAPIDKSSFVLTTILFLIFFFDDTTKGGDPLTIGMLCLTMVLMLVGTFLMIPKLDKTEIEQPKKQKMADFCHFERGVCIACVAVCQARLERHTVRCRNVLSHACRVCVCNGDRACKKRLQRRKRDHRKVLDLSHSIGHSHGRRMAS